MFRISLVTKMSLPVVLTATFAMAQTPIGRHFTPPSHVTVVFRLAPMTRMNVPCKTQPQTLTRTPTNMPRVPAPRIGRKMSMRETRSPTPRLRRRRHSYS